jgi:DNA-binding transcriptional ArsR family regulator
MLRTTAALFGDIAELCLLYIVNYGQGYIRGIASTFNVSPGAVQRQLERLEDGGILVSRRVGNVKTFEISPRLGFRDELIAMLERVLTMLPEEDTEKYFRQRRRPRLTGKEL